MCTSRAFRSIGSASLTARRASRVSFQATTTRSNEISAASAGTTSTGRPACIIRLPTSGPRIRLPSDCGLATTIRSAARADAMMKPSGSRSAERHSILSAREALASRNARSTDFNCARSSASIAVMKVSATGPSAKYGDMVASPAATPMVRAPNKSASFADAVRTPRGGRSRSSAAINTA